MPTTPPVAPGATPDPKAPSAAPAAGASAGVPSSTGGSATPATGSADTSKPLRVSLADRLAAAKASVAAEASNGTGTPSSPSPTGTAPAEKAASEDPKAGEADPAKEPPKPEPKIAKAWAELADRESAMVEAQKTVKAEKAEIEKTRTELAPVLEARKLVAAGDHYGALKALGIDMEQAQEQYLATVREPTTEDLVTKRVQEALEAAKKAETDAKAKTDAETQEQAKQAAGQRVNAFLDGVEAAFKASPDDFDLIASLGKGPDDVLQHAVLMERETGKTPTAAEALKAYEETLAARVAKSKKFSPAAAPGTAGDKQTGAQDTTPRTLTSSTAGEVPLSPEARAAVLKKSPRQRLEEAKREAGLA